MQIPITIRSELACDVAHIEQLTIRAFANEPHSDHCEQFIIRELRNQQALSISLVAQAQEKIVGHVAVSPVHINGRHCQWYGLGPISVEPGLQNKGIGSALMHAALRQLKRIGAHGCVLLGDPSFYQRFGFASCSALTLADVPPEYFQVLLLQGSRPAGAVTYHEAFQAKS